MLIEYFDIHISILVSLAVIVVCLTGSIIFSTYHKKIDIPENANGKDLRNNDQP